MALGSSWRPSPPVDAAGASRFLLSYRVGDSSQRRDCSGSSKVAVSDRTTFGALSQFVFNDRDRVSGKRLAPREMSDWMCVKGGFAVRVVEGARLESQAGQRC